MFCGNCGTKIEGGYKFCPKCGAKVSAAKTVSTENESSKRKDLDSVNEESEYLLSEKNENETSTDMAKHIICPNCGAPNEHDGKCDFCGAPLVIQQTNDEQDKQTKKKSKKLSQSSFKVKGMRKVDVDSRVLEQVYDKFTNTTTTKLKVLVDEEGKIQLGLWELNLSFIHKYSVANGKISDVCEIGGDFFGFNTDNEIYKVEYYDSLVLDKVTLKSVCQAKRISFLHNTDEEIFDKENIIALIAQLFYHTFYDNNCYKDAANKVYNLVYNERFDERIFERYYTIDDDGDNGISRELKNLIVTYDYYGNENEEGTNEIDDCNIYYSRGHCSLYVHYSYIDYQDYRENHKTSDIIHLNDSEIFKNGELSKENLLKLCEAKKIAHIDGTKVRGLSLMAQVFYHAIYDPNAYPDAADNFYSLCQSINKDEKRKALARRTELQKQEEERRNGGVVGRIEKKKKKSIGDWLMDIFCNV